MSTPEPRHQAALDRFLQDQPTLAAELEHLNPLAAQAAGLTLEQYRAERLHEALSMCLEGLDLFAWELTLKLTAATPEEFTEQRLEVHREVAEMAHMAWPEYAEMHGLDV
jgi:hypothetical protein